LWTLEGIGDSSADLLFQALKDPHPQIRVAATRQLEHLSQNNDTIRMKFQSSLALGWRDESVEMVLQTALAAVCFDDEVAFSVLSGIAGQAGDSALIRDAIMSSLADREYGFLNHLLGSRQWEVQNPSSEILFEILASAISRKADPKQMKGLMEMLNPEDGPFGWQKRSLLIGIALQGLQKPENPIQLTAEPSLFSSREKLDTTLQNRINSASHIFSWPGKTLTGSSDERVLLDERGRK
jgi:hypothetical protein